MFNRIVVEVLSHAPGTRVGTPKRNIVVVLALLLLAIGAVGLLLRTG